MTADRPRLSPVAAVLDAAVARGTAPAAAAAVVARGRVVHESFHGTDAPPGGAGGAAVGPEHLFDVASLTKVMATGSVAAVLASEGLDLDAPASTWLRRLRGEKSGVTIRRLLAHAAGFPPVREYRGEDLEEWIAATPLRSAPGTSATYSDVGFVALGLVLERAGGGPLDHLGEARVFRPLGLARTAFAPAARRRGGPFVPTARANRPGDVRSGEPDDDVARALDGVAGHAGLFATARDAASLGQAWMDAFRGRSPWLSAAVAGEFVARDARTPGSTRALAWDLPSGAEPAIGSRLGRGIDGAIGHLGFTGTSLWIDLDHEVVCALLTNHCPAPGDVARIRRLRRAFHDAVAEGLGV